MLPGPARETWLRLFFRWCRRRRQKIRFDFDHGGICLVPIGCHFLHRVRKFPPVGFGAAGQQTFNQPIDINIALHRNSDQAGQAAQRFVVHLEKLVRVHDDFFKILDPFTVTFVFHISIRFCAVADAGLVVSSILDQRGVAATRRLPGVSNTSSTRRVHLKIAGRAVETFCRNA